MSAGNGAVALIERVPVENVRPGDEILVGRLGLHVVSAVRLWEDGTVTVVYYRRGQQAYENRARETGRSSRAFLVELALAAMPAGAPVDVVRGRPEWAEELRRQMEREQTERWDRLEERLREERR